MAYEKNIEAMKLNIKKCLCPFEALVAILTEDTAAIAALKSKVEAIQNYNISLDSDFEALTEEQKLEMISSYSRPVIDDEFVAAHGGE